jgi:hypothetical protein
MEDDLHFWQMEDDLHFWQMEDNLNTLVIGRQPPSQNLNYKNVKGHYGNGDSASY